MNSRSFHEEHDEYEARIAERIKRINTLIQRMVTTPRVPRQTDWQVGHLYLHHNKETNSFFLMHRRPDGTFECVDRMSFADPEAEGLSLRVR